MAFPNYLSNSYNSYEFEDFGDVKVVDYKTLNPEKLYDIDNYNVDFKVGSMIEGQFVEVLANNLYESVDYWDFLQILNYKDKIFDNTYSIDTLNDIVDSENAEYFYNPIRPYQGNLSEDFIENYKQQKLTEKIETQDFKKLWRYLPKDQFLKLVRFIKYNY